MRTQEDVRNSNVWEDKAKVCGTCKYFERNPTDGFDFFGRCYYARVPIGQHPASYHISRNDWCYDWKGF